MILTIDQGTSSSRALIISPEGEILGVEQKEFKQIYPQAGWVEHDPIEIWETTLEVCRNLVTRLKSENKLSDLEGIAITNQRETTVLWDKRDGKPVYNAIVWQCRRTAEYCKELRSDSCFVDAIRQKTGLLIDSYFSGPKISWTLKEKASEIEKIGLENIAFGTIDTWILWNLTRDSDPVHATDSSNASRTMLFDIAEEKWDQGILNKLEIPGEILPEVRASNSEFGASDLFKDLIGKELPVLAILGDQQAAFYAHHDSAKITYGTGSFVLTPQDDSSKSFQLSSGLLTSIGYTKEVSGKAGGLEKKFITEGSIFIGGAIVQWLRDELGIIQKSSEIEALARSVESSNGLYLIPALSGLGAPFWKENVRGALFGISRGANKAHIARAALEGIAFRVKDVFHRLESETAQVIDSVNVDGGASKNDLLMQFQADLLGKEIRRFEESEMTALGVARMTEKVDFKFKPVRVFKPEKDLAERYLEWLDYLGKLI